MSLDGRIDDCSPARLVLSSSADLDRVDEVRAASDAILVGASTVRRDDPGLAVRSERRRAARVAAGRPPTPLRAVLTREGDLNPASRFFRDGAERVVYRATGRAPAAATSTVAGAGAESAPGSGVVTGGLPALEAMATVVDLPDPPLEHLLADLAGRRVRRLMVEGGSTVHTAFLTAGLVDELHLVVAPFFVGDPDAPTFVNPGRFPFDVRHRLTLAEVRQLGDVVLLRYLAPA